MNELFRINGSVLLEYVGSDKEVSIPEGITKIAEAAFYGRKDLVNITFSSSVTTIEKEAFKNCLSLRCVNFTENIKNIGLSIFEGCTNLKSVVIQSGILKIPSRAFYGCINLNEVILPDSLVQIGEYAFCSCNNLKHITLPDNIEKLQAYAFSNCSNLNDIEISKNITKINEGVFQRCTNLTHISIPEGVTEIQKQAFLDCKNLKRISIPASVSKIEIGSYTGGAFDGCATLEQIEISPQNPYFKEENGIIFSKDYSELVFCLRSKTGAFEIPSKVHKIGAFAFNQCNKLKSINIPDSVTEIGSDAFNSCTELADINIPNDIEQIPPYLFRACKNLKQIKLPDALTTIGKYAFENAGLETVVIPEKVKELGNFAFNKCPLSEVTFLGETKFGAHTLGDDAFDLYAWKISIVNIHKNYEKNAILTFAKCYLKQFSKDLPAQVSNDYIEYIKKRRKRLYDIALEHFPILMLMIEESIITWKDLMELKEKAGKLNNSEVNAVLIDYQNRHFADISQEEEETKEIERELNVQMKILETGIVPIGVIKKSWTYRKKEDGSIIISGYKGTETNVIVPEKIGDAIVTEIGEYAFSEVASHATPKAREIRKKLVSVVIPNGVTKIGEGAFSYCSSLTNVIIPEGVSVIEDNTFQGCSSLRTIVLPNTIKKIGTFVFEQCRNLTSVTLSANVKRIDAFAFPMQCPKLTIYAPRGSSAQRYAWERKFNFKEIKPEDCK